MTDTSQQIVINPVYITLGLSLLRTVLQVCGAGAFATAHDSDIQAVAGALVTLGTTAWGLYSWWAAREKQKALIYAQPHEVTVK